MSDVIFYDAMPGLDKILESQGKMVHIKKKVYFMYDKGDSPMQERDYALDKVAEQASESGATAVIITEDQLVRVSKIRTGWAVAGNAVLIVDAPQEVQL